jgi:hypothetical protein
LEGLHSLDKLERLHDVLLTVHDQANQRTKLIVEGLKKKSTVENFKNGSPEYTLIVNEYHD